MRSPRALFYFFSIAPPLLPLFAKKTFFVALPLLIYRHRALSRIREKKEINDTGGGGRGEKVDTERSYRDTICYVLLHEIYPNRKVWYRSSDIFKVIRNALRLLECSNRWKCGKPLRSTTTSKLLNLPRSSKLLVFSRSSQLSGIFKTAARYLNNPRGDVTFLIITFKVLTLITLCDNDLTRSQSYFY